MRFSGMQIDAAPCGHFAALRLVRLPAFAVCAATLRKRGKSAALTSAHFYGFEATSQFFKRKELDAHLMKRIDGILYVCFGGEEMRPIHRLDKDADGSVRLMWAYGRWEDAESLHYIPINETMEIPNKEIT